MKILGIAGLTRQSAACLVDAGRVVAAAAEERFSRIRGDGRFPAGAIAYCLEAADVQSTAAIDVVAFHERPRASLDRAAWSLLRGSAREAARDLDAHGRSWMPGRPGSRLGVASAIGALLPEFRGRLLDVPHHIALAAHAFFTSSFPEAAILTVADGEWSTATIATGHANRLAMIREQRFPHSIELACAALARYAGFDGVDAADRFMSAAAFGQPRFERALREHAVKLDDLGGIVLDEGYIDIRSREATSRLVGLLGREPRRVGEPLGEFECDLAASAQRIVETAVVTMSRSAKSMTNARSLCLTGELAANPAVVARVAEDAGFDRVWVPPASDTSGAALGAALAAWHVAFDKPRPPLSADYDDRLGPDFSGAEIRAFLDRFALPYHECDRSELTAMVAQALTDGRIVGLFTGRMPFGSNGLGQRTLLGDARRVETRQRINAIKDREAQSPCVCAVLADAASEWFGIQVATTPTRARRTSRSGIPAAVHADGSSRPRRVDVAAEPVLHGVIEALRRQTGVPVLVTASFRIGSEPVVCTPVDAYRAMMRSTDIDAVVLEDVLVWRHEQPQSSGSAAPS